MKDRNHSNALFAILVSLQKPIVRGMSKISMASLPEKRSEIPYLSMRLLRMVINILSILQ